MNVIVILIFFALLFALFFLAAFFWASKDGQFDDVDTPAQRILFEDGTFKQKTTKEKL